MQHQGNVYLVGSGPGDQGYLTVRGDQLLTQAQVLVYDALVDEALMQRVPDTCVLVDVGKRGGKPSTPQADINRLLVEYCRQGKQVVRLKSGDPFIFGRCTSEIEALKQAGCAFEVVPGISSALAAPLLASIPLTDPVLSRCFAVASAHEPDALNWEALAAVDTLVILMGGSRLPEIVDHLERQGRSPFTPIAVIRWAGHPDQQIWTGTLATIVQQTAHQTLSPCVITIGEVVGLRPYLEAPASVEDRERDSSICLSPTLSTSMAVTEPISRSHSLPLQGKTILVTRSASQSSEFTTLLQNEGATVMEMPALEIGPPSSWEPLDQAIAHLSDFDWLILTSTNGVDYFFERLAAQGKDARALGGVKIAVVGQKTAQSLKQHGLQADFIPPNFVADALVEHFPEPELRGVRLLFPRVETGGREVLVKELTERGAEVVEVPAYQSGCVQAIPTAVLDALAHNQVNIITFASSKTVHCFHHLLVTRDQQVEPSRPLLPISKSVCIASIGPQTSTACQRWLGRVDLEAAEYTLEGLTQALVQSVTKPQESYTPD